jgi:hypothetical protein
MNFILPHILLFAVIGLAVGYHKYGEGIWYAFKYSLYQDGIYYVAAGSLTLVWLIAVPSLYVIFGVMYFYLILGCIRTEMELA